MIKEDAIKLSRTDPFLWHLSGEAVGSRRFSHRHWWTSEPDEVNRYSARWEVFRRHPETHRLLLTAELRQPAILTRSKIRALLRAHAGSDWSKLEKRERELWTEAVQTELRPQTAFAKASDSQLTLIGDPSSQPALDHVWVAPFFLSNLKERWLIDETQKCFERLRAGQVLIAVDPSLPGLQLKLAQVAEELVRVVEKCADRSNKLKAPKRDRERDWLKIIRDFEENRIRNKASTKIDSQITVRYKRLMQRVEWPQVSIKRSGKKIKIGRVDDISPLEETLRALS